MNDINRMQRFTSISGEIDSLYHEAAFRLGQSDSSMTVLYTLLNSGGKCDISDICRLAGMRKQTLNSALRKLEKEGLVCLENINGKHKSVVLTEAGSIAAENSAGVLQKIEEQALEGWSDEEIETYLNLSERFRNDFRDLVNGLASAPGSDAGREAAH